MAIAYRNGRSRHETHAKRDERNRTRRKVGKCVFRCHHRQRHSRGCIREVERRRRDAAFLESWWCKNRVIKGTPPHQKLCFLLTHIITVIPTSDFTYPCYALETRRTHTQIFGKATRCYEYWTPHHVVVFEEENGV